MQVWIEREGGDGKFKKYLSVKNMYVILFLKWKDFDAMKRQQK